MNFNIAKTFRPKSGALAFFVSILVWGIGCGCFMAAMNNYLSEIHQMNSLDRGWLEFFRELPGLALVFILALLHRVSDWKVMRIGTMISMAGAALLLVPADKIFVTLPKFMIPVRYPSDCPACPSCDTCIAIAARTGNTRCSPRL